MYIVSLHSPQHTASSTIALSMKLLKFVDGDAPLVQTPAAKFDSNTNTLTAGPSVPKIWVGEPLESSTQAGGSYWLVDDNGKLIGPVSSIVMMRTELPSSKYAPEGICEAHTEGLDFRNAMGKAIDTKRAEYGVMYKNAAVKPSLMNHQERVSNRQETIKREREAVELQISGKEVPAEAAAAKKGARKEKK